MYSSQFPFFYANVDAVQKSEVEINHIVNFYITSVCPKVFPLLEEECKPDYYPHDKHDI